jgi:hypothetical protein
VSIPSGGGGGVRIVINPADLRRGAGRLRGVAVDLNATTVRAQSEPFPSMPADVVADARSTIDSVVSVLTTLVNPFGESAVELDRRALWAEIADQLIAGVPLSSAQLREFMEGLKDGSLVRYAEPWQAELAGALVGNMYRDNYTQIPKLEELARILLANGRDGAFAAGFVEGFGAENVAEIPRVLQAATSPQALLMGLPGLTENARRDLAALFTQDEYDWRYDRDNALEILGAFSLILATATTSGRLDRSVEQDLAYDGDRWALAQLVHENVFGTEFLTDLFHSGVIAWIDAGMDDPRPTSMFGGYDEGPILVSGDQMVMIMEAVGRNSEASAQILTAPIPEQFRQSLTESYELGDHDPLERNDVLQILYRHGDWGDQGAALAEVYTNGVNHLWANASDGHNLQYAHVATQTLVDETLDPERWEIPAMTHALAQDLVAHHLEDLQRGAFANIPNDPGGSDLAGRLIVDSTEVSDGMYLQFGTNEITDVVRAIAEHDDSYDLFLGGVADFQHDWVASHVGNSSDLTWAAEMGAFDGALQNASDLERFEDFDSGNSAHEKFFMFVHAGTGFIPNPFVSAGTDITVSILEGATAPDPNDVIHSNHDAQAVFSNAAQAQIALGYYEAGLIDTPPPSPADYEPEDGRPPREYFTDLANWVTSNEVQQEIRSAISELDRGWRNADLDT